MNINIDRIKYPWRSMDAYAAFYDALSNEAAKCGHHFRRDAAATVLADMLVDDGRGEFVADLVLSHRWRDVAPACYTTETRAAFEAIWLAGEFDQAYAFVPKPASAVTIRPR